MHLWGDPQKTQRDRWWGRTLIPTIQHIPGAGTHTHTLSLSLSLSLMHMHTCTHTLTCTHTHTCIGTCSQSNTHTHAHTTFMHIFHPSVPPHVQIHLNKQARGQQNALPHYIALLKSSRHNGPLQSTNPSPSCLCYNRKYTIIILAHKQRTYR